MKLPFKIINRIALALLKNKAKLWDERTRMTRDNIIQNKKEKLVKKYKKYFGRWFRSCSGYENFVFQITGIYYAGRSYSECGDFKFSCYVPNWEDSTEVDLDDVIEGRCEECRKEDIF